MPVSPNSVVTPQAVKSANARCTAAKITYGDNANAVKLLDAGANGSVLFGLTAIPEGVLAADNKLMLFRSKDNGATLRYVRAVNVKAYAADAAGTAPIQADFGYSETSPLRLQTGDSLWLGTFAAAANGIAADAQYEDL